MRFISVQTVLVLAAGFWMPVVAAADITPVVQVVSGETTWEGDVLIDGVVIVTQTGILTVRAGTTVRFVPRDDDSDGIGDSELRVEGELKVQGTPDDPVLFTSAAAAPEPADWKYVMVNHAHGVSMANSVIEYAYSGVQVHYTRGVFTGLTARHNVDGFRFSTAQVSLTGSLLIENENGIRFEERGAGADIRKNRIVRNRVGVFAVVKCRGLTVFAENAVEENSDYNVKLGIDQSEDLPMAGNWWGKAEAAAIESGFFDGRVEEGLGKVLFEPFLTDRPALARTR
ncbi:MAG: NosD domain-containing protein [bacterium]|nr:NosD domain-containing protein [bacterium]MDT8394998.1 NosD domain-containing protein [bacterium]